MLRWRNDTDVGLILFGEVIGSYAKSGSEVDLPGAVPLSVVGGLSNGQCSWPELSGLLNGTNAGIGVSVVRARLVFLYAMTPRGSWTLDPPLVRIATIRVLDD